jgi:hypothetical protein
VDLKDPSSRFFLFANGAEFDPQEIIRLHRSCGTISELVPLSDTEHYLQAAHIMRDAWASDPETKMLSGLGRGWVDVRYWGGEVIRWHFRLFLIVGSVVPMVSWEALDGMGILGDV